MQFSKDSTKCMKHLLNEFSKSVDKDINKKSRSVQNKMDEHLSKFFTSLQESYKVMKSIKKSSRRFSSVLSKIKIPEQIPKSHLFDSEFISHSIKKYIEDHATIDLCYKFVIHSIEYKVHFVLLDEKEMIAPEKYEKYMIFIKVSFSGNLSPFMYLERDTGDIFKSLAKVLFLIFLNLR